MNNKLKKIYEEILALKTNNHPLDLNSCKYITDIINNNMIENMLEVGTGLGFSSYFFAINSCIKKIDTVEKCYQNYQYAKNIDTTQKINYINQDILLFNPIVKYQLIFIDGPKKNQDIIFNHVQKYLTNDGIIVIDNIFLNRIKEKQTKQSLKLLSNHNNFLNYLESRQDYNLEYVEIDDGLAILRRK